MHFPPLPGASGAKIQKKGRRMVNQLIWFLVLLLVLTALRLTVVEIVRVKGRSMLPTLENHQWLLVSRLDYRLGEPQRGDVVICHFPGRYMDKFKLFPQYFVKRLIALPGETIEVIDGVVHIDGVPLEESYLDPERTRFRRNMPPRTLDDDEYYVMGDNRDNSNDSRRIGPISRRMIVGRVRRILFPFRSWKSLTDK